MELNNAERRQFLKRLSGAVGAATAVSLLSPAGMSAAFAYTPKANSEAQDGSVFSRHEMLLLRDIADTILPKTDTPSASDVDCHGFVDHQLAHVYDGRQQKKMKAFLKRFNEACLKNYKNVFADLNTTEKAFALVELESERGFSSEDKRVFKELKSLIVFGYFTSEVGASKVLSYQPLPGGYKGSIPCDENTKSWGSLAFF